MNSSMRIHTAYSSMSKSNQTTPFVRCCEIGCRPERSNTTSEKNGEAKKIAPGKYGHKQKKAPAFPRGLFVALCRAKSFIVSRRFPFLADLAVTYFSKP